MHPSLRRVLLLGTLGLLCAGCQMRSISDPGYYSENRLYAGELSEADVIGALGSVADAASIQTALGKHSTPRLRQGGSMMLVQSGALFPDYDLLAAFGGAYHITTFSGLPAARVAGRQDGAAAAAAVSYRLAAALAGIDTIVCVWGVLESARHDLDTKAVSWIPVVGWAIHDETLETRLRLRFVIVDVASGNWSAFMPEPSADVASSSMLGREPSGEPASIGTEQALSLKQRSIGPAVRAFLAQYGKQ
jgi:hypothetical protein